MKQRIRLLAMVSSIGLAVFCLIRMVFFATGAIEPDWVFATYGAGLLAWAWGDLARKLFRQIRDE